MRDSDADVAAPARPVALIILDGWGIAPEGPGNAVAQASTPTFDALAATCPTTELKASGAHVGLPTGQIGNSEVGHLNLGAGRIVPQDLMRINAAVDAGELDRHPVLSDAVGRCHERGRRIHILGLASHGGVHSRISHIEAVAHACRELGADAGTVIVHAFTDGRDVSPEAARTDIAEMDARLAPMGVHIGSVIGRYWAMDRDRRWDRTQRAYDLLVHGAGAPAPTPADAVELAHRSGTTDEFIEPHLIVEGNDAVPRIEDGDLVIYANFRPDRTRQLCHALVDRDFAGFDRDDAPGVELVTMTRYDGTLDVPVLFDEQVVASTLADVLEDAGVGQLHVAETEKYAHVTYFFNGGREVEHRGEVRRLVPSPRDVATYDEKPEMSCREAADAFIAGISHPDVGFGVLNFANPDMVGHTGSIPAAVAAVEAVDTQLARVVEAVHARGGRCLITADHGNAEQMLTDDGKPHTAHTTNPVPLILTGAASDVELRDGGILGDIAPTVLVLLGIQAPELMTGTPLLSAARATR